MGNACRSFGFDNDDGMRIFTIVEMFLACYHVIAASYVYKYMFEGLYNKGKERTQTEDAIFIMGFFFAIFLVLQAIAGFLLYLKGWKERNATICYTWIALALINKTLSMMIAVTELASGTANKTWNRFFLYLFYVFYGVWVVKSFMVWAKEQGFQTFNVCCCTWDQLLRRNVVRIDPELASTRSPKGKPSKTKPGDEKSAAAPKAGPSKEQKAAKGKDEETATERRQSKASAATAPTLKNPRAHRKP